MNDSAAAFDRNSSKDINTETRATLAKSIVGYQSALISGRSNATVWDTSIRDPR